MLHIERRMCAMKDCGGLVRPRGRVCQRCATRAWRERRRSEGRDPDAQRTFTPEQRAKRNARSTLHTYVKRGTVARGRCAVCADRDASPLILDPSKPLEARWYCRSHYIERTEAREMSAAEWAAALSKIAELRERIAALDSNNKLDLVQHLADVFYCRDDLDAPSPWVQLGIAIVAQRRLATYESKPKEEAPSSPRMPLGKPTLVDFRDDHAQIVSY